MHYPTLTMAEALDPHNKIHLANLQLSGGNDCMHGSFIANDGVPTKIAPDNCISDSTGVQADIIQIYVARLRLRGGIVRYFLADCVSRISHLCHKDGRTFGPPLGELNANSMPRQCDALPGRTLQCPHLCRRSRSSP